ncbi:hypothetical protein, partial [Mycobacterium alsense]|uniref:hypothetical protein n=1 Tax=Mycobacterium alsense TaxID=324058 RepID=UPI001A9744E3
MIHDAHLHGIRPYITIAARLAKAALTRSRGRHPPAGCAPILPGVLSRIEGALRLIGAAALAVCAA